MWYMRQEGVVGYAIALSWKLALLLLLQYLSYSHCISYLIISLTQLFWSYSKGTLEYPMTFPFVFMKFSQEGNEKAFFLSWREKRWNTQTEGVILTLNMCVYAQVCTIDSLLSSLHLTCFPSPLGSILTEPKTHWTAAASRLALRTLMPG